MIKTTLLGALLFAFACGGADKKEQTMPATPAGTDAAEMDNTATNDQTTATDSTPAPKPSPMPASDAEVVFFAFDSAELTDAGKAELADEIAWLNENPSRHIVLHGYTDDVGTPSYNLTLGNARANSVRTYMNTQGIDLVRLHVVSHGESGPELTDELERRALFVGTIKK